jgi:ribosomal protein L32
MFRCFLRTLRSTCNRTTATNVYPWTALNSVVDQLHETILKNLNRWTNNLIFQQQSRFIQPILFDVNGTVQIPVDANTTSGFDESMSIGLDGNDILQSPSIIYMAVPKSKVTRSKKRMKTTVQKRIPMKHHIVVDSRTGEVTLRHRLPFNWKDYLPFSDSSKTESNSVKTK